MTDDDRTITPEMIAQCTTDRLILMRDLILLPLTIHSRYLDVIPMIDQELRRRGLFPQTTYGRTPH